MLKLNLKLIAGAALSAALLAGCGGGGGGGEAVGPSGPTQQTITSVVSFIQNLIASNGANTDPIDVNVLTLATDDTSEPIPLQ